MDFKSSSNKYYLFSCDEEIKKFRENANRKYINTFKHPSEALKQCFLTVEEELIIVRYYEKELKQFLQGFKPRNELLPKEVKGTSLHFYKKFFVMSSVMDYHPKEVMITCIFLACKTSEYVVPIDTFVRGIEGNPNILKNIILDQEMELLYRLNFKINIHTPYRAIEGLFLDLKTRSKLHQPERLCSHIKWWMSSMWHTDVCLLYPPAQVALAAIMHAVSRCKENIDQFVMTTLLNCPTPANLQTIVNTVRKIRSAVMHLRPLPTAEEVVVLEKKMLPCRNPQNDPSSREFKQRMMENALEDYGK